MLPSQGLVLYEGPSQLTGDPVVVLLTGLLAPSSNRKTGPMCQVYILAQGQTPGEAAKSGLDGAVCGGCPHRPAVSGGQGTCYVTLWQGPRQVYNQYELGRYDRYEPSVHDKWLSGRAMRFGAYGDPAAVPVEVWENLAGLARNHTGYTHQWRTADPAFAQIMMASVDSEAERLEAQALGYRTFRVRETGDESETPGEIVCPASNEFQDAKGYKITCLECGLCSGAKRAGARGIVITAHGVKAKQFQSAGVTQEVITDIPVLA